MNATGLAIALAVAAAVGLVFGIWPELDLKLAAIFFDSKSVIFKPETNRPLRSVTVNRTLTRLTPTLSVYGGVCAYACKVIHNSRMSSDARFIGLMLS